MYSQSSIEQLGMCSVRLRLKDKTVNFSFFVVPGDCPLLLGMQDIEVLDLLKIMCEVMGDPHKSRMSQFSNNAGNQQPSCRANSAQQIKADKADSKILTQIHQIISAPAQSNRQEQVRYL